MSKIHPTALIDANARIADGVEIGPYCIVEADVQIGEGCVLRGGAILRRYTTMGAGNFVDSTAVLGGEPQDLKFDPRTVSYLRIGDHNVFREGVTISRATGEGMETRVGNQTYWMAGSHAGHNATVEDQAILVNGSAIAGHSTLGRKSILSAHVVVHQFCWIGEMVMSQGNSGVGMHVPPYTIFADVNRVVGLNTIGLRRSPDITAEDRRQIKEAFNITYRSGLGLAQTVEKMDACTDWGAPAGKFRDFVRKVLHAQRPYNRGLPQLRMERGSSAE